MNRLRTFGNYGSANLSNVHIKEIQGIVDCLNIVWHVFYKISVIEHVENILSSSVNLLTMSVEMLQN